MMSELLYLLNLILPNFREIIGAVGTAMLVVGALNAFFGYKLFQTMLSIMGFLVGAVIGLTVFLGSGNLGGSDAMWLYMLGGGVLGSALAELFHSLGVFISVGGMGAVVAFVTTQDTRTSCIVGVICGIAGVWAEKYAIIVTSALSGGSLVAAGLWMKAAASGENRETGWIGWIVGICGILFQLWLERRSPAQAVKEKAVDGSSWAELLKGLRDIRPESVRRTALKSILVLPMVIGLVLGNLSESAILGCGFAVAMYIPLLIQFVRKYRAEARYGIPAPVKYGWERWVNEVLIDNILFTLVLPGSFCLLCCVTPFALDLDDLGIIFFMLLGLAVFIAGFILSARCLSHYRSRLLKLSQDAEEKAPAPVKPAREAGGTEERAFPAGVCPLCGFPLRTSSVFCGGCGVRLERPVRESGSYCGRCGTKLPEGAAFCRECGAARVQQ